jgi:26S proteasome regulatory subunit N13
VSQPQIDRLDARLTDILSPANIASLVANKPDLVQTLVPLLPPGLELSENPTTQDLIPILQAPQFTDAIASLDNALRSGGLPGSMMRELGLAESAGTSVKAFLEALIGLAPNSGGGGDAMDTD